MVDIVASYELPMMLFQFLLRMADIKEGGIGEDWNLIQKITNGILAIAQEGVADVKNWDNLLTINKYFFKNIYAGIVWQSIFQLLTNDYFNIAE